MDIIDEYGMIIQIMASKKMTDFDSFNMPLLKRKLCRIKLH